MGKIVITTNPQKGSEKDVKVKKITFEELWSNYPRNKKEYVHNDKNIKDYCAIKVSIALIKSGVKINKSFKGTVCWGCPQKARHAIRAQELADWLNKQPFAGILKAKKYKGENFRKNINELTGIVFFKDYWQRDTDSESSRTGDHIDLWDGRGVDKLASQGSVSNFFTNTLGVHWDGFYSDKNKSKEVWFWEIK